MYLLYVRYPICRGINLGPGQDCTVGAADLRVDHGRRGDRF